MVTCAYEMLGAHRHREDCVDSAHSSFTTQAQGNSDRSLKVTTFTCPHFQYIGHDLVYVAVRVGDERMLVNPEIFAGLREDWTSVKGFHIPHMPWLP